ncbi:hypothetical protein Vretimale_18432 [Volvox reticuliferus]|uniref:Serine aminopeptidase S33 domain-containing protein n=1 Tax=Volvox reticuliferus TaxID=1737510 RepID=A0A8J4GYM3_9CHLO|nr:hypothetical protein Vretifemale_19163 [Volvox reticuliferus]GIM15687.1 hypothetical protein Vretimale_18432 [Volvox reticuliferus]
MGVAMWTVSVVAPHAQRIPLKMWGYSADHLAQRLCRDLCCRMHLGTNHVKRSRLAGRSTSPPLLRGPASNCKRCSSILQAAPWGRSPQNGQNQDLQYNPDSEHDDSDPQDVESLPLRWLTMERHEAASVAYRHYLPASPSPNPRLSSPPPLPMPSSLSSDTTTQISMTAAAAGGATAAYDDSMDGSPDVCVFYCNGLKSHMTSAKVRRALNVATSCNCEFVCFDYSGFGASTGRLFQMCGLQDWIDDAAALMTRVVRARRVILVGSSIGGWVALRLAQLMDQISDVFPAAGISNSSGPTNAAVATATGSLPASTSVDSNTSINISISNNSGNPAFLARSGGAAPAAGSSIRTKTRSGDQCPALEEHHGRATFRPTITSLLLIAPAVDIAEVRWAALTEAQQRAVLYENGLASLGSPYQMDNGDLVGLPYFCQGRRNLMHCPDARAEPLVPGVSHLGPLVGLPPPPLPQGHYPWLGAGSIATNMTATFVPQNAAEGRCLTAVNGTAGFPLLPSPSRQGGGEQGTSDSMEVGIAVGIPVVILHGSDDEVVPIQHAEMLAEALNRNRPASVLARVSSAVRPGSCEAGTAVACLALDTSGVPQPSKVAASCARSGVRMGNLVPEILGADAAAGSGSTQCAHGNAGRVSGIAGDPRAFLHVLVGGDHRISCPEGLRMLQRSLSLLITQAKCVETCT